jgi:hypothetical protein
LLGRDGIFKITIFVIYMGYSNVKSDGMFYLRCALPIFLVLLVELAIAQQTLDFFIPPCPSVGIIEEERPSPAIRVFPQPAIDELTISFENFDMVDEGAAEIKMYTILGRPIFMEAVASGATTSRLAVRDLPAGVYLLQIRINLEYHTRRIIVGDK